MVIFLEFLDMVTRGIFSKIVPFGMELINNVITNKLVINKSWVVEVQDINKLERAQRSMLRMMYDVSSKDRTLSQLIVS